MRFSSGFASHGERTMIFWFRVNILVHDTAVRSNLVSASAASIFVICPNVSCYFHVLVIKRMAAGATGNRYPVMFVNATSN